MGTIENRWMTADELLQMPDNGFCYELVEGELRKIVPPGHVHGNVAMNIGIPLGHHVKGHKLGRVYAAETGFKLGSNPDTVRAPDAAFVRKERVEEVGDTRGYFPGAPDLAVEVTSPGDTYAEVEETVLAWLAAGTRLVVVANPKKRTVSLYRSPTDIRILSERDTMDLSDVVPNFTLPVASVFE